MKKDQEIRGGSLNKYLVDTDILSYFLKGVSIVRENFKHRLLNRRSISISSIIFYEIYGGLAAIEAEKKMKYFLDFASNIDVLPATESSAKISGEIYSDLRKSGNVIDDIDLLIAGIAIDNNLVLVTNNENHFGRIPMPTLKNWSK